jgi:hypothetical protein
MFIRIADVQHFWEGIVNRFAISNIQIMKSVTSVTDFIIWILQNVFTLPIKLGRLILIKEENMNINAYLPNTGCSR